jgi:peptidoglycan/xylan/chitin deacetylase (PgdA/CDA1 family)
MKGIPETQKQKLIQQIQETTGVRIPTDHFEDLVLSWTEIDEMSERNIRFGSHTVTHPILTQIPLSQAKTEIMNSKKELERKLGQPITTFAYPNGLREDFNPEIMDILAQNGFTCAVTMIPGRVDTDTNPYMLKRVGPGWNFDAFKFVLAGLYYRR